MVVLSSLDGIGGSNGASMVPDGIEDVFGDGIPPQDAQDGVDDVFGDGIPLQDAQDGVDDGAVSSFVPSPRRLDDHLWILFEARGETMAKVLQCFNFKFIRFSIHKSGESLLLC